MKNVSFRRNGVEFEPTKQELKIVLDDFAKRLADLEKELQDWQDGTIIAQWQDCEQRVKELEKQLAEKDTQIQSQKKNLEFFYDVFNNSEHYQTFSDINQAKTDFAIGQLEQVKQWCSKYEEDIIDKEDGLVSKAIGLDQPIYSAEIGLYDFIDNQIKELRGQK